MNYNSVFIIWELRRNNFGCEDDSEILALDLTGAMVLEERGYGLKALEKNLLVC